MSNRCYLYLTNGPGNVDARAIAEGANSLPLSWMLLLGKARKSAPVRYQRVFGDNDSPAIVAPAAAGLEALRRFVALVLEDPRSATVEPLQRYLEAMLSFLEREIVAFERGGAQAWFSIDAEELTWMDEEADPVRAIESYCQECTEYLRFLDELASMPVSARAGLLDEWMCFEELRTGFTDWSGWCWRLGLDTFDDPYFTNACDEPQQVALDVFATREERLPVPGDGELPPLQWLRIDGLWGLFDQDGAHALVAPGFTRVNAFHEGFAIVEQAEAQGLIDRSGRLIVPVEYDYVEWPRDGLVVVWKNELGGWFDLNGQLRVPLRFSRIDWFETRPWLWVEDQGSFHRVGVDGAPLDENRFTTLPHKTWNDCWQVTTAGGSGLLDHEARWVIPAHWDMLRALPGVQEFIVGRDGLQGVIDRQERVRIALQFAEVDLLGVIELNDRSSVDSRLVLTRDAGQRLGCWDLDRGTELLPCRYAEIHGVRGDDAVTDWLMAVERNRSGRVRVTAFDWRGQRLPQAQDPQRLLGKDMFDEVMLVERCRSQWRLGGAADGGARRAIEDAEPFEDALADDPATPTVDSNPAPARRRVSGWWLALAGLIIWIILKRLLLGQH